MVYLAWIYKGAPMSGETWTIHAVHNVPWCLSLLTLPNVTKNIWTTFARTKSYTIEVHSVASMGKFISNTNLSSTCQPVTRFSNTDVQAQFPDMKIPHNIFRVVFRRFFLLLFPLVLLDSGRWYTLKHIYIL